MSEIDQILNAMLSSEVSGLLLVLFHKNPGLIDTIEGVARRIGRNGTSVEKDLDALVNLGALRRKQVGSSEVIFYDRARDKEIQQIIVNHLNANVSP